MTTACLFLSHDETAYNIVTVVNSLNGRVFDTKIIIQGNTKVHVQRLKKGLESQYFG